MTEKRKGGRALYLFIVFVMCAALLFLLRMCSPVNFDLTDDEVSTEDIIIIDELADD